MEMGLDSLSKLKSYDIVKSAIVMVMIVNPIMKLNFRVNSFSNHQAQPQALVSSQKYACYVPKIPQGRTHSYYPCHFNSYFPCQNVDRTQIAC